MTPTYEITCHECDGDGWVDLTEGDQFDSKECNECYGSGMITVEVDDATLTEILTEHFKTHNYKKR